MAFNLEDLIRWEELSNSLQEKFRNIERKAHNSVSYLDGINNSFKCTIAYQPPKNPEENNDIWWDLNYDVLLFYCRKGSIASNPVKWHRTRGAWYGGSKDDVYNPKLDEPSDQWLKVKTLSWLSNLAINGSYTTTGELDRASRFVAPITAMYRIYKVVYLYEYNKQYNYEHDGGAIKTIVKRGTRTGTGIDDYNFVTIFNLTYDSKGIFTSINSDGETFPYTDIKLKAGDCIDMYTTTTRNPKSTDKSGMMQVVSLRIFYDKNTRVYDDPVGADSVLNSKKDNLPEAGSDKYTSDS